MEAFQNRGALMEGDGCSIRPDRQGPTILAPGAADQYVALI
jgi:hypothetical protein